MSERMTNILGYLTLAAILAAIWILFGEDPTREQGARGEPTFAGLADRINETATVTIEKDGASTTIRRAEDKWVVDDRAGYPANQEKVRVFLRGFARSERREPKTSNPDRFERLGLGEQAFNVSLKDDADGDLLSVQVGTRKGSNNGRSLTYIFQPTDTRAWLVTNLEETQLEPTEWLDKQLLQIEPARFASVALNDALLVRGLGEDNFTLSDIPEGARMVPSFVRNAAVRVMANLEIDDVQKLNNPLAEPLSSATFKTHDGLVLNVTIFDYQGGSWLQLEASYDPDLRNDGDAGMLEGAPEDGAAEAAAINARTSGWLFKISDNASMELSKKKTDFIEINTSADTPS